MPLPVKVTACTPLPSLAVITHSVAGAPRGRRRESHLLDRLEPAAMVVPSGRVVSAVNGPLSGGFDLVMVRLLPPTSVNLNVSMADCPTATFP